MKCRYYQSFTTFSQRAVRKIKRKGFASAIKIAKQFGVSFFSGLHLKRTVSNAINILYVIGYETGESKRYRVHNIIEAVLSHGIFGQSVYQESLPYINPKGYSIVIFFRCKLNLYTIGFLKKCKRLSIPVVYDVDDLVFDEETVDKVRDDDGLTEKQYSMYISEVRKYTDLLKLCDYATASTKFLCEYMHELSGIKVFYIPNGLNKLQIDTALKLSIEPATDLTIGFISGTDTHNRDFMCVASSLLIIMEKYPQVRLTIVGYLKIPCSFDKFKSRIEHLAFMDYVQLLKYSSQFYVVVVPLEYNSDFCNSKSELKYFEQALVGVPVVASPTETFKACITDGFNG